MPVIAQLKIEEEFDMEPFEIVTLYIGLSVLLMAILKLNCGRVRSSSNVDFGDGGNEAMARAMRVQGNAVEDVPITLLGIIGLAYVSAPTVLLHVFGIMLIASRLLHAIGLGAGITLPRVLGAIGALFGLLGTGGCCLYFALT